MRSRPGLVGPFPPSKPRDLDLKLLRAAQISPQDCAFLRVLMTPSAIGAAASRLCTAHSASGARARQNPSPCLLDRTVALAAWGRPAFCVGHRPARLMRRQARAGSILAQ